MATAFGREGRSRSGSVGGEALVVIFQRLLSLSALSPGYFRDGKGSRPTLLTADSVTTAPRKLLDVLSAAIEFGRSPPRIVACMKMSR